MEEKDASKIKYHRPGWGGDHGNSGCMLGAKPGQMAMQGFPKELPK